MATITSTAAGNWSAGGTWIGGVAPVDGDKAVINHTVTVDDTSRAVGVDGATDSILIGASGVLKFSRAASSQLTVRGQIKHNAAGAEFDMGKVGDEIPAAYTATLILNKHAGAPGYVQCITQNGTLTDFGFYAAGDTSRKRVTRLTSSVTAGSGKTFTVADSTGWQIGDEVLFCHSDATNPAAAQWEIVTLTAVSPLTADFSFGHLSGCYCGNMESNVIIKSNDGANPAGIFLNMAGLTGQSIEVRNTKLINVGRFANGQGGLFFQDGANSPNILSPVISCHGNVHDYSGSFYVNPTPLTFSQVNRPFTVDNSVLHIPVSSTGSNVVAFNAGYSTPSFEDCIMCGANIFYTAAGSPWEGGSVTRGQMCVNTQYANPGPYASGTKYRDVILSGYGLAFSVTQQPSPIELDGCDLGVTHGWNSRFGDNLIRLGGTSNALLKIATKNCLFASAFDFPATSALLASLSQSTRIEYVNKNADITSQEVYLYSGTVKRENTTKKRGTSSIVIQPTITGADTKQTAAVQTADGESIRIVGYCQFDSNFYNTNDYTAPSVKILLPDGTALATYTATSAANGAWESFDLTATNSTGAPAELTVELTANAKTVTTGKAYFDGLAIAPFVVKCRHYGFLFDESNIRRAVNATVSANEATAAAYTGMTVTWGASASSLEITANNTFQKVYDYTQAQSCLNIASAVPLTGVGVAGNPSLFAAEDVDVTGGAVLNGAGSLSMGAYTLTATLNGGQAYTYTGGTYSRLTTLDSFSGGQLNIGAAGTFVFSQLSDMILSVTPTAPGTYALGGASFTGTVDLRNTAAHAITVELPSGVSYTTANNTGGVITVSTPQVYQQVTLTGGAAGSRVQLYDTDAAAELYNDTPGAWPFTWTDPDPAAADRTIRVRVSYVSGVTAKEFIEAVAGVCGQTEGTKAVSYIVSQVDDAVYNANGVDGPSVYATSGITFTDAATDLVNCNIGGGTVSWATIYACFAHWMNTAVGIADDIAYVQAVDQANYLLTAMKIRNTNATPLTITGGWGRDVTTLTIADVVDVAGSTGNIYPLPDHVVNNVVTVGGVNIITGDIADVSAQVQTGLTAQGLTTTRAAMIEESKKLLRNKRVIDRTTGVETIYDDNDTDPLYTRDVFVDEAGADPYDGTDAPHRVERYT